VTIKKVHTKKGILFIFLYRYRIDYCEGYKILNIIKSDKDKLINLILISFIILLQD
jgi:uncharacterized protein YpiB (UPF0302 family)